MTSRALRPAGLPEIDWWYRLVLYRFYDAAAQPVYFGTTRDFGRRWREHRAKPWWHEVAKVKLTLHPSPRILEEAEAWYIHAERPRYQEHLVRHPEWVAPGPLPNMWTDENTAFFHAWRRDQLAFFGPSRRQRIVHKLNNGVS